MTAAEITAEVASETAPECKVPGTSRIGLIVPSSNTTMQTELPEQFRGRSESTTHRYTFPSARRGGGTAGALTASRV